MQAIAAHEMPRALVYPKLFLHEEIAKLLLEEDGLYDAIKVNDFSDVYDKIELCAYVDLNQLNSGYLKERLDEISNYASDDCHPYLKHLYNIYHVNDPLYEVYVDHLLLRNLIVEFLDSRAVLIRGERIMDVYYEQDNPKQLKLFT